MLCLVAACSSMHRHESAVDPELRAFLDEVYAQGVMDFKQYAAQLQAAGVPVDLRIAANMIHSFSSLWGVSAEARTEFEEGIRAFSDLLSTPHTLQLRLKP